MRRIEIYDTTLRDGAQAEGVAFSLSNKVLLTKRLDEHGFDYVEGGFPSSNDKDRAYFYEIARTRLRNTKISAFGMTRRKGISAEEDAGLGELVKTGAPVITLVGKSSAFQVAEVLRTSHEENLNMIRQSVEYLVRMGRKVIFDAEHFFDGWKAQREYAIQTILAAAHAGASCVVLCDTNGGSMPEEIAHITREAVAAVPVPVGIHCHNDCGMAVANSLAAVDAGADHVQGTINGFGERCGNADLISVVANLAPEEARLRGSQAPVRRAPHRAVSLRLRDDQLEFPRRAAFCRKERLRP